MRNKKILVMVMSLIVLSAGITACGGNAEAVSTIASANMEGTAASEEQAEKETEQEIQPAAEASSIAKKEADKTADTEKNTKTDKRAGTKKDTESDEKNAAAEDETEEEQSEAAEVSAMYATEDISNESSDWGLRLEMKERFLLEMQVRKI